MKKGFTLIEVLAVIIVLSIVSIIAIPRVMNVIEESRLDSYYSQTLIAKRALKEYVLNNSNLVNVGDSLAVSINELQQAGRVAETLDINGYFLVTKLSDDAYDYVPHISLDEKTYETDRLLAHYPLVGNTYDYSDRNNHGEAIGSPIIGEGLIGDAYHFQNNSQYIRVPHEDYVSERVFGTSDVHTLMGFVYVDVYENWATLINKAAGGSWSNTTTGLWASSSNGITFAMGSNEDGNPGGSSSNIHYTSPLTNNWYHVVGVANGTQQILYIDGQRVGIRNITISRTRSENTQPITLGRRSVGSNPSLKGMIQDIRIYDRALSDDEIKFIYDMTIRSIES